MLEFVHRVGYANRDFGLGDLVVPEVPDSSTGFFSLPDGRPKVFVAPDFGHTVLRGGILRNLLQAGVIQGVRLIKELPERSFELQFGPVRRKFSGRVVESGYQLSDRNGVISGVLFGHIWYSDRAIDAIIGHFARDHQLSDEQEMARYAMGAVCYRHLKRNGLNEPALKKQHKMIVIRRSTSVHEIDTHRYEGARGGSGIGLIPTAG